MRKSSWIPLIVIPIVIVAVILIARLNYYGTGGASAYTPPEVPLPKVELETSPRSERLEAVDNPTISEGVVVIDYSHRNALFIEELNTLMSKVVARGFSYEIVLDPELVDEDEINITLAEKLRYAKALILPLPRSEYTSEEILEIERFVERGGRVFILGDPTRTVGVEALNSIAGSFGIIYANDYLYSLKNNDNNYRNVIYSNFANSPITTGLESDSSKVIFYAGNSINAPGNEIIIGDDSTFSSTSEGGRTNSAGALTTNDQVLALGDLTFFTEPYSAAENNGMLINNIADFLTGAQPEFKLTDFPYFLNANIDIVFDDPLVFNSQFEDAAKLKELLEDQERTVNFANEIGDENDVIFVGRYDNIEAVETYLEAASIAILEPEPEEEEDTLAEETEEAEAGEEEVTADDSGLAFVSETPIEDDGEQRFIEGRIQIEGVGDLERGGSSLFYLHQEGGRNIMLILSDTPDTNADAFELLLENQLIDCQATAQIAVCQTESPEEDLPPSIRSTRIDKILIVADDDGREREDAQTSALEYSDTFSQTTYNANIWTTSDDGSPTIDDLLNHDAVIWTTGDYWDDSIGSEDAELLIEYLQLGGNLILSGASIAFDWDHTEFLSTVTHVDYLDFAEQKDLAVSLADHTIARDFDPDTIVEFLETPSGEELLSDVVNFAPDSRVIFQRGPDSDAEGAPAVVAYEDERVKVAYYSFPIYLLPTTERALLINNTVDWFTEKILDPPDKADYEPFESDRSGQSDEEGTGDEGEGNGEDTGEEGGDESGTENGEGGEGEESGDNNEDSGSN